VSSCTNGHPLDAGDAFCAECGAPAAAEQRCANGHAMEAGDAFCQECGAAPVAESAPEPPAPPTTPTPAPQTTATGPEPAPEPAPKRRLSPVLVLSALIVVLAAILVVLLITRDRGDSTETVAFDSAQGTTTTTRASSTTRALAPATTAILDPREAFVRDLDVILMRSSQSRGQLSDALTELNTCREPGPVATQIRQIEEARNDEIEEVGQLDPPDADTQALVRTLLAALTNSRDSDATYYDIVSAMSQCESVGARARAAEVTDQAASQAKRDFVAAYNPIAASYGLKSDWREDQI
jgi:hypothetical protein